jgi:hypothetical protein
MTVDGAQQIRIGRLVIAGLVVWFSSSVYAAAYLRSGFPEILPHNLVWVPVAWQLFEYPLAALAGAATSGP